MCVLTSARRFLNVLQLHELQSVHGMQLQVRFGCMTLADCAGAVRFCLFWCLCASTNARRSG